MGRSVRLCIVALCLLPALLSCQVLVGLGEEHELYPGGIGGGGPGGFAAPRVLASPGPGARGVFASGGHVYWINDQARTLDRVKKSGTTPEVVADFAGSARCVDAGVVTGTWPVDAATDGYRAYVAVVLGSGETGTHCIMRVELESMEATVAARGPYGDPNPVRAIDVDAEWLHFSTPERGALWTGSKFSDAGLWDLVQNDPFRNITPESGTIPAELAAFGDEVYFVDDATGDVFEVPVAGDAAPAVIAPVEPGDAALFVDADASGVFFTTSAGRVMRVVSGGMPVSLLESGPPIVGGDIVVDDGAVYWCNQTNGTVMAMAKDGSGPTQIAEGQDAPLGVFVDAEGVYWSNYGSAEVVMAAKLR